MGLLNVLIIAFGMTMTSVHATDNHNHKKHNIKRDTVKTYKAKPKKKKVIFIKWEVKKVKPR